MLRHFRILNYLRTETNAGDLIIHVPDPNPNHALKMRRLIWDYLWNGEGTYGHYEGMHVMSAASGFGSLANGVSKNPNLSHNIPFVDDAGLNRGKSPGAGAISHHHNYTWTVERNLDAGDELFVEYGAGWMKERGFEDTAPNSKFDVSLLRNVGYCLDNLVQGPSLIDDAGRGAFASRELDSDSVVAPVPLIALSRSSLEMIYESQKDASLLARTQLLRNYCIGHANSSLLLYPYSHGINLINHSRKPNVRLRWWDGSRAFFEKPFLELQQSDTSQLMLELVATRQIRKGEEIVLDYGKDWAKSWNDHVENWQPREDDINHVSAESMNKDDKFLVLRTRPEQHAKPYPADVFTSCYYQYSGQTMDNPMPTASSSAPTQTVRKWKTEMIRPSRNLRPCIVLKRDKADESYLYTVHVMNRPTLTKDERIPKGHVLIATHVPRHAIVFSDKTYTSDQHLDNAFRKEIGLGDIFPEQWKDLL